MGQQSLFDEPSEDLVSGEVTPEVIAPELRRIVRVIPDEPGILKEFDYAVPQSWSDTIEIGTPVRIQLQGRRVRAWLSALDVAAKPGMQLQEMTRHNGVGPDEEILALARWAAERWVGRIATLLRTASPPTQVKAIPSLAPSSELPVGVENVLIAEALKSGGVTVVRSPPHNDEVAIVQQLARLGQILVITPTGARAQEIRAAAMRNGLDLALLPRDWAKAAAGQSAIGPRSAIWTRTKDCASILVLDAHDESFQSEQAPTWNARDVAVERARRAAIPCVLVSPVPDLATLQTGRLLKVSRNAERSGWPVVEIIDRRGDAPGPGSLLSSRLSEIVRGDDTVVCVLNRKGRAQLLRCAMCEELVVCEVCANGLHLTDELLECKACGHSRPQVCSKCDSTKLKRLRPGVARISEELAALARRKVVEVTADGPLPPRDARLLVGTEALLHRIPRAEVVVFLDIDSELLALRYRAVEQTMALLALGARLLGGRAKGGRLVVQTRQPGHVALQSLLLGDPGRVAKVEAGLRSQLMFPPFRAMAQISGAVAEGYISGLRQFDDIEIQGPADGAWLVLAETSQLLSERLMAVPRPSGRMRIAVDPLRI